jgi:oxidase EvaA
MDTRTVISGISFKVFDYLELNSLNENEHNARLLVSSINTNYSMFSFDNLIAWLTELKSRYEVKIKKVPLSSIKDWHITDKEIIHKDKRFFKVIGTKITISNREVSSWCQPLIMPAQEGLIGFIVKQIHGVLHFLVQAKFECGNFDILELAPTVQTLTGDYRLPDYEIPYLHMFLDAPKEMIWYDSMQSEEGGRFFKEQNRNMIVEVGNEFSVNVAENFTWMTLSQLNTFIKFNNYLNIQARSILSAISFL